MPSFRGPVQVTKRFSLGTTSGCEQNVHGRGENLDLKLPAMSLLVLLLLDASLAVGAAPQHLTSYSPRFGLMSLAPLCKEKDAGGTNEVKNGSQEFNAKQWYLVPSPELVAHLAVVGHGLPFASERDSREEKRRQTSSSAMRTVCVCECTCACVQVCVLTQHCPYSLGL